MTNKIVKIVLLVFSIILVFVISNMSACSMKETKIYKLEKFSTSKEKDGILYLNEVFIVANPPSNKLELMNILKGFNDSTLTKDISNRAAISRERIFYRETRELNEGFEQKDPNKSGYFDKVDLSGYYSDRLFEASWIISEKVSGNYTSYLDSKIGETEHFVRDL